MSTILEPTTTAMTIDPAAIEPTTTALEATRDPIRPTGTDALTAESRPEITATDAALQEQVAADSNMSGLDAPSTHEGLLGYKAPGLVKSFRFSKKFFWLGDEAVQPQHLGGYLRAEKPELAHHNAAYAAQTGKGLLFFAKRIEDKTQPAGILNLGEATDISKDGVAEFSFRLHGQRHSFQAATKGDRDTWFAAIESKAADGKSSREKFIGSSEHKNYLENLAKPPTLVAVPAATATTPSSKPALAGHADVNVHEVAQSRDAVAAAESSTDTANTRAKSKSRSQSRKRASIFGSLLGKKEDHDEKKPVKHEEKVEENELKQELREEKHANLSSPELAPLDAIAIAERVLGAPVVPVEAATTVVAADEPAQPMAAEPGVESSNMVNRGNAPKPNKRNSLFGGIFNKKETGSPTLERTEKDVGPTPPLKDSESTLTSAPTSQLTEPMITSSVQPTEPSQESVPDMLDTSTAPVAGDAPVQKPSPTSKGGIFGFMKPKETQHGGKKELNAEEEAVKQVEQPVIAHGNSPAPGNGAPAPSAAVIENAESINKATLPAPTLATPELAKERRRSSFFGTLGSKKERRAEPTSDSEVTDGEGKKVGKLGGLFRRPSRAAQGAKRPSNVANGNPATVSEAAEASIREDTIADSQTTGTLVGAETRSKPVGDAVPNVVADNRQTAVEASA